MKNRKKKTWWIWLLLFVICFGVAFSGMYMWRYHKAKILLMAMEKVHPKAENTELSIFPPADAMESVLSLPSGATQVPKNGEIVLSEELEARIRDWVEKNFGESFPLGSKSPFDLLPFDDGDVSLRESSSSGKKPSSGSNSSTGKDSSSGNRPSTGNRSSTGNDPSTGNRPSTGSDPSFGNRPPSSDGTSSGNNTSEETAKEKKTNKRRKDEWIELFQYLLPGNLKKEDIDERDIDIVAAIVTPKVTMSEALEMAEWFSGGLTDTEKQDVIRFLKDRFTEEELTVLVQIYRKYTEMQ